MKWLDKPDAEGFWWVTAKNGADGQRKTVACVSVMTNSVIMFNLIGYRQEFTDLDLQEGRPLFGSKWKRIVE